ncbi:MAG: DUF2127 domain-containing protein [Chlorobiaceae bacterium]|nr:DUF2127 domain-containing protein [Chlorobiaceae bacterium]
MIKTKSGLRAVAIFETVKGFLVLTAALYLFMIFHQEVEVVAGQVSRPGAFDPFRDFPNVSKILFQNMNDDRLHFLVFLAVLYSSMRFIEAYGLWFGKRWAEWFALVSGSVYLPIELYELAKGFSWLKIGLLTINLLIVLYMIIVLMRGRFSLIKESSSM